MSTINAIERLQLYLQVNPAIDTNRAAKILRSGVGSECSFDYEQALSVLDCCPKILELERESRERRLRQIIETLILEIRPSWRYLIPYGRTYLSANLSPNAQQVFDSAGLYGSASDPTIRAWWDTLSNRIRGATDAANLELGRRGEDLTLDYETRLLNALGHSTRIPKPVGFEDNTLGYDVESFRAAGGAILPKFIEVKSTDSEPLRFHLSRNQWEAAQRLGQAYFVHLWLLSTTTLVEITFDQLSEHIPSDRGRGVWDEVVVTWR